MPANSTGKVTFREGKLAGEQDRRHSTIRNSLRRGLDAFFPPWKNRLLRGPARPEADRSTEKHALPRVNFVRQGGKPLESFASRADYCGRSTDRKPNSDHDFTKHAAPNRCTPWR